MGRVGRLAKEAAAEAHGRPDRLERVRGQFLRDKTDLGSRGPGVADDVMASGHDGASGRIDDPADDIDQRRLACAIGTKQAKYLSLADLQVDFLEGLEARGIGLAQTGHGNNRLHGQLSRGQSVKEYAPVRTLGDSHVHGPTALTLETQYATTFRHARTIRGG
jgi:hypothetical protein